MSKAYVAIKAVIEKLANEDDVDIGDIIGALRVATINAEQVLRVRITQDITRIEDEEEAK